MKMTICCTPRGVRFTDLIRKANAKTIDRERKAIKSLRFKLRAVVRKHLKHVALNIARQVVHARMLLCKAEASDDDLNRILDSLNLDWSALESDTTPIIQKILEDSGAVALDQIDAVTERALKLVNERAVEYAKERSADLVTNISESTRGMLRSDVSDALESGASNDQLAATLEENYAFSSSRAEVIARTETAYADVQGNLKAYEASGVVDQLEWMTGAGCCELCDQLDGDVIDLGETFDTEDGPITAPPYHPNCRCDVKPITAKNNDLGNAEENSD